MRPQSIGMFDKLYLGGLLVGLLNYVISWDSIMSELAGSGFGVAFAVITASIGYGISLLLWYFISRRASNIAKWILVALTAIGLAFMPFGLIGTPILELVLSLVITAMQVGAIYFLFQPDAKDYLESGGKDRIDPSTFE
ncbi:MAG: hypothetical protein AAF941_00070 [Pseudomonadota bacterium]